MGGLTSFIEQNYLYIAESLVILSIVIFAAYVMYRMGLFNVNKK